MASMTYPPEQQYIAIHYRLSTSRLNHLIALINAWSANSLEYNHGSLHNSIVSWIPGETHDLIEDSDDDAGNDGGDDDLENHGNGNHGTHDGGESGDDGNGHGDDNIHQEAVANGNNLTVAVFNGIPPLPGDVNTAGEQRKRSITDENDEKKNNKRKRI
ncbi:uncharacterized protein LOC18011308 [Eutrema salsugineum]|uniref:uncharacterized protein LOC18011308 n=1 Tax=Eutrema salsugineum TaxID=72664 RepID=UPI000CED7ADB|nr:uncharacterized protein LOC18011308 [Eutrema salsugineum]XP_024006215.1 uncharacterized protein LOC18011308 [Eutrema salsugineum]